MPNHVRNVLKFSKLNPHERDFILERFTKEMEDDVYPLNLVFDFNTVIPEPKTEAECPEDCKTHEYSHISVDKDRPWFDWYTWRNKYWGTKWGAYDGYVKIGTSTVTFVFSTAWAAPYPIYERLATYPFRFEVRYADEDWGSNCGFLNYEPDGETGKMKLHHTIAEDCCKNPSGFAKRLWENY